MSAPAHQYKLHLNINRRVVSMHQYKLLHRNLNLLKRAPHPYRKDLAPAHHRNCTRTPDLHLIIDRYTSTHWGQLHPYIKFCTLKAKTTSFMYPLHMQPKTNKRNLATSLEPREQLYN